MHTKVSECLEQYTPILGYHGSIAPFLTYLTLLETWNAVHHLTSIVSPHARAVRYILDSLAILPWMHGSFFLDVGSGAGLPGIALAIANPEQHWTLIDSQHKKIAFLREVQRVLTLCNVKIVHDRVERYQTIQPFDTIVSCAFSDLTSFTQWTKHLLATHGQWVAMKGRHPREELMKINRPYRVENYQVPTLDAERCCIIIPA